MKNMSGMPFIGLAMVMSMPGRVEMAAAQTRATNSESA
jgi:hypothetical protein